MGSNDLVSIIVPIYNMEKYLWNCLYSLSIQTYKNIEIIMVNDGSTDGSKKICRFFQKADKRFKLWNKENGGLSSTRNKGLELATGKYISFVDADDWVLEDFIEKLVNAIDNGSDIVISDYYFGDEIGNIIEKKSAVSQEKVYRGEKKEKEILVRHVSAYPCCGFEVTIDTMSVWKNLYRRDFLHRNNLSFISEREAFPEDQLFNTEAYQKAEMITVINYRGYVYRVLNNGLSHTYRNNFYELTRRAACYQRKYLLKQELHNKKEIEKAINTYDVLTISRALYLIAISKERNKRKKIKEIIVKKSTGKILKMKDRYILSLPFEIMVKIAGINNVTLYVMVCSFLDVINMVRKKAKISVV